MVARDVYLVHQVAHDRDTVLLAQQEPGHMVGKGLPVAAVFLEPHHLPGGAGGDRTGSGSSFRRASARR
ncbi:hypothetical protein [Streptomyces aureocirculatus]|uniref:hypothetical protein n=1 Tax=Streptomyces aureocirculatus TaxID=67275 RepID=UPI0004C77CDE|nr:hypothetical protein [Streptomyces aureocirculatus]